MKFNKYVIFYLLSLPTVMVTATSLVAAPAGNRTNGKGVLALELQQYKVLSKVGGKEELVPVEKVNPGETIEYQLKCVNGTGQRITSLQPRLPLPLGLSFVPKSTSPDDVVASLDGKTWGAIPLKRKIKLPNGEQKTVTVPFSEYRFLRWMVPELGAGKSVKLVARARVTSRSQNGA